MASTSADLILLTGATGHIGFRVLRYALQAGYRVRAAVRSDSKAEKIAKHPCISSYTDSLSFTIVPDFLAEHPFDEAVHDVKFIIHVASPLSSAAPDGSDVQKYFIEPAVNGTLGILQAAQKEKSVKRVVITSSVASLIPNDYMSNPERHPDLVVSADGRFPFSEDGLTSNLAKYAASKTAAFLKAEEFVKEQKPAFDVIHIHPTFVFGRDELTETLADFKTGTNRIPLSLALGTPGVPAMMFAWVHVHDVARIHVEALDARVKGNQSFLLNKEEQKLSWDDTNAIVAKHFPKAVADGRLPNNATYKMIPFKGDAKKTIDTFGEFQGYEEAVRSVVEHYLEVLEKEQQSN